MSDALYGRHLYVFSGSSDKEQSPTSDPFGLKTKPEIGKKAYEHDTGVIYTFYDIWRVSGKITSNGVESSAITIQSLSATTQGEFNISGVTNTWPSDDSFSIRPSLFHNVRSFRFLATRTAGASSGCRYAIDADDEALAEQLLTSSPNNPNIQYSTYSELKDGVFSDWIDLSDSLALPPLLRVDFLADNAADTFDIKMETR